MSACIYCGSNEHDYVECTTMTCPVSTKQHTESASLALQELANDIEDAVSWIIVPADIHHAAFEFAKLLRKEAQK